MHAVVCTHALASCGPRTIDRRALRLRRLGPHCAATPPSFEDSYTCTNGARMLYRHESNGGRLATVRAHPQGAPSVYVRVCICICACMRMQTNCDRRGPHLLTHVCALDTPTHTHIYMDICIDMHVHIHICVCGRISTYAYEHMESGRGDVGWWWRRASTLTLGQSWAVLGGG